MCQLWVEGGREAEAYLVDLLRKSNERDGICNECMHLVRLVGHSEECSQKLGAS